MRSEREHIPLDSMTAEQKRLIILAADDSEAATNLTAFVAKNFSDCRVLVCHIQCSAPYEMAWDNTLEAYTPGLVLSMEDQLAQDSVLFIKQRVTPPLAAANIPFEAEVIRITESGNAAIGEALCKKATKASATLMLLNRSSKIALTRFFVGSVTKYCVEHSPCPVVVI